MEFVRLGRTDLQASVVGLGCGGHSRLGQTTGRTQEESVEIVRQAIDLGINFIDTAEVYGTENIVGRAIANMQREQVILSTKKSMYREGELVTPQQLAAGLETSLRQLNTDYVDIYHLHAVAAKDYDYAREQLMPTMETLQAQGKLRYLGITEEFGQDTRHHMLTRAIADGCWDVMMVGFNLLNQSARPLLAQTLKQDIGVLIMFAVRRSLNSQANLQATVDKLRAEGLVDDLYDADTIEKLLVEQGGATSIQDAAYRFCRYEEGVHVTLSGTGNPDHLAQNCASLLRPPLPLHVVQTIRTVFARVDSVSGNTGAETA